MTTAFEAITSRVAWYASEEVEKYDAVMYDLVGKFAKADGSGQFAGIVQYGAEQPDRMTTVVRGVFPAIGTENIVAGAKVTIASGADAGRFKVAGTGDIIYGTALTGAAKNNLFALAMADVVVAAPATVVLTYAAGANGTVDKATETIVVTGNALGATATADSNFKFKNWTNAAGDIVSVEAKLAPPRINGLYVADTYTANFESAN